jgi:hypothetical protein
MHRITILLLAAAVAALPAIANAQDVRLRGGFVPLLAPAADTRAPVGEVRAILEEDGDVRIDMVVSGMTETARTATLHLGRGSEAGEQVGRLDVSTQGSEARIIGGTLRLTPAVAARVRDGDAFVLVRTSEHADGLLRAALAPQARSLEAVLSDD